MDSKKYQQIMIDFSENKLFTASGKLVTDERTAREIADLVAKGENRRLNDHEILKQFGLVND